MAETSVNEKIREIISYYKLSDRQFSIKIGVTQSVIGSMFQKNTEPSSKVIRLTLNAFTDISADWLLRNKGPMLISDIKPDPNIERMERLVDTIATLQGTINEQMKTNQLLTEKLKKIESELAMLKNERNVG
ncbi:helix-turn-helix domain-containing protein [Bacteroides caecimuris]|uniref:helix-turn-helix domain-containing protein n=1 Tax=Bacteroides caecimuris TaxID=1796613 RepID=UPI001C3E4039|nr:helix-turn-helix domain-containing protein [Bacteroides caecimuris]